MTFGIGEATSAITQLGVLLSIAFQAVAHGMTQGVVSGIQGGNFWQGAASGALASIGASAWGGLGGNFARSGAGQITFGTISGGAGAALTGGNFWQGAATGFVVSAANHVAHRIEQNKRIRVRIVRTAKKYEGSKEWAKAIEKDNFDAGTHKCIKFVYDVLKESGASPGLPNGNPVKKFFGYGSPPTAGQWRDPNYNIPGWRVVSSPQAGDIAAYSYQYSDATGHVALMLSPTTSIGANEFIVRITDFDIIHLIYLKMLIILTEDMLEIKKIIMIVIPIIIIGFMVHWFDSNYIVLNQTKSYEFYNDQGKKIEACIYEQDKDSKGNAVNELIIDFLDKEKESMLLVAPKEEILGLGNNIYPFRQFGNTFFKISSFKFKIANYGDYFGKPINITFENDKITFDTFSSFTRFGETLELRKTLIE